MIATIERPMATIRPLPKVASGGQEARDLALACLRYESACWRGEPAHAFAMRLGSFWRPELPPTPTTEPDAFSPHGAGGRGISWFERSGEVLGYIAGRRCGYRMPVAAVPDLARCVPQGPCRPLVAPGRDAFQAVIH